VASLFAGALRLNWADAANSRGFLPANSQPLRINKRLLFVRNSELSRQFRRIGCGWVSLNKPRDQRSRLYMASMSNAFSLGEVQVSSSPRERFEEYLQSRGKRITQQRRALVDYIFERHDHFDADKLIESLAHRPDGDKISRPTVYRTLDQLVEAGLLRKMSLGGRAVYEHDYGYPQHDHLYCQLCDKLIEFSSEELQSLRDAVAREHNFRVTGHRLIITGVCNDCSRKRHRRQSPLDLI
jgi:Fur family transcriptional regulator, ferric uptake regulator